MKTLDNFLGIKKKEKNNKDCVRKTKIEDGGKRTRISWKKNPRYDEILRKHYFALNGKNYAQKVIDEMGIKTTAPAIHFRVNSLGLYKELQIRKAEAFMDKRILPKNQRLILKKWRSFNDLLYTDKHYLFRPGLYEIRNKSIDVNYVGYSLNLFYRLYYGYARPDQANKKHQGNSYIIQSIKKHGINGYEFRIAETYHKWDSLNRFFRDDGSFNADLLDIYWKHRESLLIHKRLDQGINLVNQLENPYVTNPEVTNK